MVGPRFRLTARNREESSADVDVRLPLADFGRYVSWAAFSVDPLANLINKPDFDVYQQIVNGLAYFETAGVSLGRQLAGAALFFVPRAMWADKAIPTGDLVGWASGYAFTNLSAPPALEGLVDFGVPGALAVTVGPNGVVIPSRPRLRARVGAP